MMIKDKKAKENKFAKSNQDIIRSMRRAVICTHISAEEGMASHIAMTINEGIDRIEALEKEITMLKSMVKYEIDKSNEEVDVYDE